jgi:hypothetical protein
MGFTEPDTPPSVPGQMPQAGTPGPAPVPYGGPGQALEPPLYGPPGVDFGVHPGAGVMQGVSGNAVQESGYAHDLSAGLVAPYSPGAISPVYTGGAPDAGGRDDVAGTIAGAVANAEARFAEHYQDTLPQGSVIGDLMTFPPSPLDPPAGPGLTSPSGGYYDPPRGYGG